MHLLLTFLIKLQFWRIQFDTHSVSNILWLLFLSLIIDILVFTSFKKCDSIDTSYNRKEEMGLFPWALWRVWSVLPTSEEWQLLYSFLYLLFVHWYSYINHGSHNWKRIWWVLHSIDSFPICLSQLHSHHRCEAFEWFLCWTPSLEPLSLLQSWCELLSDEQINDQAIEFWYLVQANKIISNVMKLNWIISKKRLKELDY